MKVSFYTLGCKVNQNETGSLAQLFIQNGFEVAADGEKADVYIVNSCTVTAQGDKKSRQWLRRAKREAPDAVTVLTGCFPQAFADEAALVNEADVVTGSSARRRILDDVLLFMQTGKRIIDIVPHEKGEAFEELPMEHLEERTRSFMKIEDGCGRQCAYCVIPRARGNVRSRSEESILAELKSLSESGYGEAVFTGINLSSYGKDFKDGTTLADIVLKASQQGCIKRIRLGSLEPDLMDEKAIATLKKADRLCPQFHLALQSGCDETLRRMRRVYTTAEFKTVMANIRASFPNASFTTDVIVGFPGETDEEFEKSVEFIKSCGFLKVHVFSFSRREGTPAYDMPNQIDEHEKSRRNHVLQTAADEIRAQIIKGMLGSECEVLLEKPISATSFTGYTREYVPVVVSAKGHSVNDIVRCTLGEFDGERCKAACCE